MERFESNLPGRLRSVVRSTWGATKIDEHRALTSALLDEASVAHAFTMPPDNMSLDCGPGADAAEQRRHSLCTALGTDPAKLTTMQQVHGSRVAVLDASMAGRCVEGADGLVVDQPGVPLLALSADCPLVAVYDPQKHVLGLAHAGWRGTIGGIARNLVSTMTSTYGCQVGELLAAITPSAGPDRYEVGDEVFRQAAETLDNHDRFFARRGDSLFFDLWSANVEQLHLAGIAGERIDLAGMCTIADERFYSYRRDGATTGHAALLAVLR